MLFYKLAGKTVRYISYALVAEEAVGILPATVEYPVGLVIFHIEMLRRIVTHGIAHCIKLGRTHSHMCQQIATASEIAQSKRGCKSQLAECLLPHNLGRHTWIAFEAEIVAHKHLLSCRCVEVDSGKIFFAIKGDKCDCHSGDTIGHIAVVGIMK